MCDLRFFLYPFSLKHQCEGQRSDCRNVWANSYFWGVRHLYMGHVQHRDDAPKVKKARLEHTSHLAGVFDSMDPDEARDAADPYLPAEKVKEYHERYLERMKKALAEAGEKDVEAMFH